MVCVGLAAFALLIAPHAGRVSRSSGFLTTTPAPRVVAVIEYRNNPDIGRDRRDRHDPRKHGAARRPSSLAHCRNYAQAGYRVPISVINLPCQTALNTSYRDRDLMLHLVREPDEQRIASNILAGRGPR